MWLYSGNDTIIFQRSIGFLSSLSFDRPTPRASGRGGQREHAGDPSDDAADAEPQPAQHREVNAEKFSGTKHIPWCEHLPDHEMEAQPCHSGRAAG